MLTDFVRKGTLHRRETAAADVASLIKEANQALSIASTLKPVDKDRDDYAYQGVVRLATALLGAAGYHSSHKTEDGDLFVAIKRLLPEQKKFADLADEWRGRRALIAKGKSWPVEAAEADERLERAWSFRAAVFEWIRTHRRDVAAP